ncbi:MAG: Gfo/Idh/MocA family oxidoreductase [Candidatus Brocadiia bacterium]
MDIPRICIVGAGNLSSRRIHPNRAPAGARLVGVCDLDRQKAERNASLYGGRPYTDMEQMLDEQQPDCCIICIGPEQHPRLAPVVMRRGIPVYTEKPPAPSAAQALEVARVSKETGILCTIAFKKRYCNAYSRAREWLGKFDPDDYYSIAIDYASRQ